MHNTAVTGCMVRLIGSRGRILNLKPLQHLFLLLRKSALKTNTHIGILRCLSSIATARAIKHNLYGKMKVPWKLAVWPAILATIAAAALISVVLESGNNGKYEELDLVRVSTTCMLFCGI